MTENYSNILITFRICSKCSVVKVVASEFKPKRQECNDCFKQRKRDYYKDNLMKFKTYYQEKKTTGVATSFKTVKA